MSKKDNTAKSFAEDGLEDVMAEAPGAELAVQRDEDTPSASDWDESDLQSVGGLEPLAGYYQLKTPTKQGKTPIKIFEKGGTLKGYFEKVFVKDAKTKDGRKFKSYTYVVRLVSDGKLYGLSGPGLAKGFEKLEPGKDSKVIVTYMGSAPKKDGTGDWENFDIRGSKLKPTP